LKRIRQKRSASIEVFDLVTDSLPPELSLSLTRLSLSDRELQLSGTSTNSGAVTSFLSKLRSSGLLEPVELTRWRKEGRAFRFEILGHRKE
jgi:Tfp pilus assembly protein PilN